MNKAANVPLPDRRRADVLAALQKWNEYGVSDPTPEQEAEAEARGSEAERWRGLPDVPVVVPLRDSPGWHVTVRWVVDGDALVPSAITLSAPPGESLSAVALRRVKVADVVRVTRPRAQVNLLGRAWLEERHGVPVGFDARRAAESATPKRGRKRHYSDDHYREVVRVYLDAASTGRPPVQAVAHEVWPEGKREEIATGADLARLVSRAKGWVQRARVLGLFEEVERERVRVALDEQMDASRREDGTDG